MCECEWGWGGGVNKRDTATEEVRAEKAAAMAVVLGAAWSCTREKLSC